MERLSRALPHALGYMPQQDGGDEPEIEGVPQAEGGELRGIPRFCSGGTRSDLREVQSRRLDLSAQAAAVAPAEHLGGAQGLSDLSVREFLRGYRYLGAAPDAGHGNRGSAWCHEPRGHWVRRAPAVILLVGALVVLAVATARGYVAQAQFSAAESLASAEGPDTNSSAGEVVAALEERAAAASSDDDGGSSSQSLSSSLSGKHQLSKATVTLLEGNSSSRSSTSPARTEVDLHAASASASGSSSGPSVSSMRGSSSSSSDSSSNSSSGSTSSSSSSDSSSSSGSSSGRNSSSDPSVSSIRGGLGTTGRPVEPAGDVAKSSSSSSSSSSGVTGSQTRDKNTTAEDAVGQVLDDSELRVLLKGQGLQNERQDALEWYPRPYLPGQWPTVYEYEGDFPAGFVWGMGTAAYQIEGGYREGGRGASIWDTFTGADTVGMPGADCSYCCQETPCPIHWGMHDPGATGNVAADHYHMWKSDVALMKSMGLENYRFSISWPRLIPTGRLKDGKNQEGIDFYNKLINELLGAGITPYVTLYHWDLPQGLLDPPALQAWWSRDDEGKPDGQLLPDWLDYVELCFKEFGDRVQTWITFNEPWTFVFLGSGYGKAPSIEYFNNMTTDPLIAAHNVLNAHAAAVQLYRQKFQPKQKGSISINANCDWREPRTSDPRDIVAAEESVLFTLGWFAEPIFGPDGDYPEAMREAHGSLLPEFTDEQKKLLKGSSDFFGLNHYGTAWAAYDENSTDVDLAHAALTSKGLVQGQSDWLHGAAWGFRKLLNWVSRRYNRPPIMITESGWSMKAESAEEGTRDEERILYYANYTSEMRRAIYEDNVDVRGYFAWSLMDNFEWDNGYKERFGTAYTEYNFGLDEHASANEESQPVAGKQWRQRKESSCLLEAMFRKNRLIKPSSVHYKRCASGIELNGEFRDAEKLECTHNLVVEFPGTRGKIFRGCGNKNKAYSGDYASADLVGSTIIANFTRLGGPSRQIGYWNTMESAIEWGDGGRWTKVHLDNADFEIRKQ